MHVGKLLVFFLIFFSFNYALTILNNCANINTPGDYLINGFIKQPGGTCFNITANNVNVICNGHLIGDNSSNMFQITANNVRVRNCIINSSLYAFYITGGANISIYNVSSFHSDTEIYNSYFAVMTGGQNIYFENLTAYGRYQKMFYLFSGSGVIRNLNIIMSSVPSIEIKSPINNLTLENIIFDKLPEYGNNIVIDGAKNIKINNVTADVSYTRFFAFLNNPNPAENITISNLHLYSTEAGNQNSYMFEFSCSVCKNVSLINSTIFNISSYVFYVHSSSVFYDVKIFNNNITIINTSRYFRYDTAYNINMSLNTTKEYKTNKIGGLYIGGNFWGSSVTRGYSDTCNDIDNDTICDYRYEIANFSGGTYIDYLPLSSRPSINIITPLNDTYTNNTTVFTTWSVEGLYSAWNCKINLNNSTTFDVLGQNTTNYTFELAEGVYFFNVTCFDGYKYAVSQNIKMTIDTTPPIISNIDISFQNDPINYVRITCSVNESYVSSVLISLFNNIQNVTLNKINGNSYYGDFYQSFEEKEYITQCIVFDRSGQVGEMNKTFNYTFSETIDWGEFNFSGVNVSILYPKNQETIPFRQYYITFEINHVFNVPQTATCQFFVSYDLDYTNKHITFSKIYILNETKTTIREALNTEISFLDYVGNYNRDYATRERVYIICGLSNKYAGSGHIEYSVHYPSVFTYILGILIGIFTIITLLLFVFSDYGIIAALIQMFLLLFFILSLATDGVSNAFYFKQIIYFFYIFTNVLFMLSLIKIGFENWKEMREGL